MYLLPSPFNLRDIDPASDSDTAFIRVLYRSSRGDLLQMQAEPSFVEELIGMQQRMQEQGYSQAYPQARYLMIEKAGQPVGRLIVNPGQGALRVLDITLLPQSQGQGTGALVLAGLQQRAAADGCSVSLAVSHANQRARALYARLGFVQESEDGIMQQLRWSPA